MQTRKNKEALKDIVLSEDSNLNLPTVSFPSSYKPQGEVKYGAKSIDQKLASEHQLLEYQRRVSRKESILSSEEIRTLVSETNARRLALEQSMNEQKQAFQQRRTAELTENRIKQREEQRAYRIAHENDEQRRKRVEAEEEVKTSRAKEIQALVNKSRIEKEEVETFFLQSSNRFNEKYGNATKKIASETGIDRIISSRTFTDHRFAHRCVPCGYHEPESLSISKIYQHVFEDKDNHMQFTINEIDRYYDNLIAETRRKHATEDNPDLKQQKLSKDLEALRKLKGAKYR